MRQVWRDPGRATGLHSCTFSTFCGSLTKDREKALGPLPKQNIPSPQPTGCWRVMGPQEWTLFLSPDALRDGTGSPHPQ